VKEDTAMNIVTTCLAAAIPLTLLLLLFGLLWAAGRIEQRRNERYAKQIALTDAIHRELGAVAAPTLHRRRGGGWTVTMAVPFDQPSTVAALLRITQRLASYEVVLTPRVNPQKPGRDPRSTVDHPVRAAA